jgi:hypothetical protein
MTLENDRDVGSIKREARDRRRGIEEPEAAGFRKGRRPVRQRPIISIVSHHEITDCGSADSKNQNKKTIASHWNSPFFALTF